MLKVLKIFIENEILKRVIYKVLCYFYCSKIVFKGEKFNDVFIIVGFIFCLRGLYSNFYYAFLETYKLLE